MNLPDLSNKSLDEIKAEIVEREEELARRKQQYIAEGEKFGLQCIDPNGTPKRKRRNSKHEQA